MKRRLIFHALKGMLFGIATVFLLTVWSPTTALAIDPDGPDDAESDEVDEAREWRKKNRTSPTASVEKKTKVETPSTASEQIKTDFDPAFIGLKKRLAVIGMRNAVKSEAIPNESWKIGDGLSEILTTELFKTHRFIMVERSALSEIIKEQELGQTGMVGRKTAARVGKLLGAQVLVTGAVTEFESSVGGGGAGIGLAGFALGFETESAHVAVDIRLVDSSTGEILKSYNAEGNADKTGLAFSAEVSGVTFGSDAFFKTPIGQATRDAIASAVGFIVNEMKVIPWVGHVIKVKGNQVYVNAGSNMNIKAGSVLAAYSKGDSLIDPATGMNLGSTESYIGTVTLGQIQDKFSVGIYNGNWPLRRGDILKLTSGTSPQIAKKAGTQGASPPTSNLLSSLDSRLEQEGYKVEKSQETYQQPSRQQTPNPYSPQQVMPRASQASQLQPLGLQESQPRAWAGSATPSGSAGLQESPGYQPPPANTYGQAANPQQSYQPEPSRMEVARPEAKKPKVMIVIDEKVAGVFGTTGFENVGQAESTLIDRFIKAGFPVVDSQTIRRNLPRDKALRLLEGDQKAAAVAGLQFGAQVVITGNAISKNAGGKLAGTNMQSLQATVQVRAVRTDDGQIISSQSAQGTQAHIDEVQGGAMAIQQAIRQLAGPLIADIQKVSLGQGSLATQEIKLVISGLVSYRHLMAVRNYLERGLQGVKSVNMRHFTQGTAELSVNYAGESIAIADKLAYQKFRGFRLEPTNVTTNRLDIRAVVEEKGQR